MEKAISYISVMPTTKAEIKAFKENVINDLMSGNHDIISVAIQLKAMEALIKELQGDYRFKELAVDEASRETEYANAKIEVAELGVKYDYSVCNDDEYNNLDTEVKKLSGLKKARENLLKSLTGETPNQQTGELICPPVKTSKTGIKITLK